MHNHLPDSSAHIKTNCNTLEPLAPGSPIPPPIVLKKSTSLPLLGPQASCSTQDLKLVVDLTDLGSAADHTKSTVINIIDLTNSDDHDNNGDLSCHIKYPSISTMLVELCTEYLALDFMQFEEVLIVNGFVYVSQIAGEKVEQQLRDLLIPISIINLIFYQAGRLMRCAEKLKQV